jgi:3-hydroxyisobutyrate dehydrogenase/2-hydroxy-3-oxopropionate reductase
MTRVAVIGLGAMGGRIARRFLEAGYDVAVWNRDATKAAPLAALGATPARTPSEATRRADAVVTMVSDPQALRDVTEGPAGVAAGAGVSTTVIQMATVGPASVTRLASALPAGAGLLDAPVLGSLSEVESGSLRIFVGGPAELMERWKPLLSALGTPLHVGSLGAGTAAKLMANSVLFGVLCVLGEALALGEGLGLSRAAAFEALAATPLGAQAERRRPAVESGRYPARFSMSLARKDADLIFEAAAASGTDLRLAAAARTWFAEAGGEGSDPDYSAVLARILERSSRRSRT